MSSEMERLEKYTGHIWQVCGALGRIRNAYLLFGIAGFPTWPARLATSFERQEFENKNVLKQSKHKGALLATFFGSRCDK